MKIDRPTIHLISRYSNWSEQRVDQILKEQVFNDSNAWSAFLKILFLSLGVGFTTAGIIFFFAYNWADLHKFVKLGLIESIIFLMILVVVFIPAKQIIKDILFTGTTFLVGALLAVFGQIYQTGANAYDFFLGWTLFVALWVFISDFAPMWLIFLTLINTTFVLYSQQVAKDWNDILVCFLLFCFNSLAIITFLLLNRAGKKQVSPEWLTNLMAIASSLFAIIGFMAAIFGQSEAFFLPLFLLTVAGYGAAIFYGFKSKKRFYLSVVSLSVIVIITAYLSRIWRGHGMMALITIFDIVSITIVINQLIMIQKKWDNEQQ